ncbi:MAG: extracellular solute-binding protein [Limnochordaceae bacterium]|nr:extracellular solute-binding protein [Limnochordaceae bacterium]
MERFAFFEQATQALRRGLVATAVTAGLSLASLGAAGYVASAASGPVVITHWQHSSPARDKVIEQLAAMFNKSHKDVQVKLQFYDESEFFSKLITALATNLGPDTFQLPAGMVPGYKSVGAIQPLDSRLVSTAQVDKEFAPATVAHLKLDGRYYGLPVDAQTIVFFYNPNLMEQAGLDANRPPRTWDEVVSQARKILKQDAQGKTQIEGAATGGYGPVLATLMIQAGSPLWDKALDLPAFNDPGAAKGFQYALDLVQRYKVEDPGVDRWTFFRKEQLGFVWAHPGMIGSFRATVPNLKFGVVEAPAATAGGSQASLLTNWALVVSKKAPVAPATEWIQFVTSAEAERIYTVATGELPSRLSELQRDEYVQDPLLRPVMDSVRHGVPTPWTTRRLDDEFLRKAYQLVLIEGSSPSAALEWLNQQGQLAERQERNKKTLE